MLSEHSGITAHNVTYAYDVRDVVRGVSVSVQPGDTLALIGPNGCGKTTLLRLLSGTLQPRTGRVNLDGQNLTRLKPKEIARRVAVVAQHIDQGLAFTVRDLVGMGRTPYLSAFGSLSRADRRAIEDSLHAVEVGSLATRQFSELSGGEQQRVMVALALAQETSFVLLDEPTVHLDLHHQHELLELLVRLQRERGIGLLAVMHDLNLASLYFQRIAVMSAGSLVTEGAPQSILTRPEVLSVFRAPLAVINHPRTGIPQVLLDREPSP